MSLADSSADAMAEVDRVFAKFLIAGSTFAEADLRFGEAATTFAQEKTRFSEAKSAYEGVRSEVFRKISRTAAKARHEKVKLDMVNEETNKRQREA